MMQFKTMVSNALRSSFNKMIDGDTREWPPKCTVFVYQPQRPKITGNKDKISDTEILRRNER